MYGQLLNLLDKAKVLRFSREMGGERYVKHFDAWQHLVIMLYAVIKRFDSLREITDSMFPEARKLSHLGISLMPRRSTLSDANARRKECFFQAVYRDLYATYKDELSSDSRFTSAATNDSFMLRPSNYTSGDIVALDRAYIDYAKFEELSRREVVYVTKMKKKLVYEIESDTMYMHPEGVMEYRVQHVIFHKHVKEGEDIAHHARIITYADIKKGKARIVSLLTNDMDMEVEDIVAIYRKRWEICLVQQQQAGGGGEANHFDGVHLHKLGAYERGGKEKQADVELPCIGAGCAEVLFVHQQERGGSQQSHHRGPEGGEDALHSIGVHVFHEHLANENHQHQRGQHQSEGGRCRPQHGHGVAVAGIVNGGVAAVGGRVNADWAGGHLRDGHDVGELCRREPVVVHHRLGLYERKHAVAAAESEQTYLEECIEQL